MIGKEHAKKYLGLATAALGVALLAPGLSQAAFTGLQRSTETAVATLTGTGSVAFDVSIHTLAGASDTAINWTGVTLPASFVDANDYIQLNSTITASGGGIEIYTDNMAADASPAYTGDPAVNPPSGLISTSSTTARLPLAWTIKSGVVGSTGPVVADPNNTSDPNSFQWLYFEDRSQVAIASQNVSAFADGAPFITVDNSSGIHFAQSPSSFGPAPSPDYVYFESNFTAAQTPNTYKTSTLRLEAYTQ